jgi:hypothetical protein
MAIHVRRGSGAVLTALVAAVNGIRAQLAAAGQHFHADVTSISVGDFEAPRAVQLEVSSPRATDLNSLLRLVADIAGKVGVHVRDVSAHLATDPASALAIAGAPVDLPQAQAILNDAKAKWNGHLTRAGVHVTNDTTNGITAPDATNLQTAIDLANTFRAVVNTHIASAPPGHAVVLIGP